MLSVVGFGATFHASVASFVSAVELVHIQSTYICTSRKVT